MSLCHKIVYLRNYLLADLLEDCIELLWLSAICQGGFCDLVLGDAAKNVFYRFK